MYLPPPVAYRLLLVGFMILCVLGVDAETLRLSDFSFRQLTITDGLTTNDVKQIYQDRDGFIWIATSSGLSRYDGYSMMNYKSNFRDWHLFTSNRIQSLADDANGNLYVGTSDGLNILNKRTGLVKKVEKPALRNNPIDKILVTSKGQVLLGTNRGLVQYEPVRDTCIVFTRKMTNDIMPQTSVKTLLEDHLGNIWIGTWNEGLYRYDPKEGRYYAYPKMNDMKSAHVLFEDSRHRIWLGTWGFGLCLLENPYDMQRVKWTVYRNGGDGGNSIIDNTIYSISEDLNTGTLWIGTPVGLSVLSFGNGEFTNFYPNGVSHTIPGGEVSSIIRDMQGTMWVGLIGSGVSLVSTYRQNFVLNPLEGVKEKFATASVRALFEDKSGMLWLGIGTRNLVVMDRATGKWWSTNDLPAFRHVIPTTSFFSILSFMQSPTTGKIYIGTYDNGLIVYDPANPTTQVEHYLPETTPWLLGGRVYAVLEDSRQRVWIGTERGISVLDPKFGAVKFDKLKLEGRDVDELVVSSFVEDSNGDIWVGSTGHGVLRVSGRGDRKAYRIADYEPINGRLDSQNVFCLYRDAKGRIWVGSEGGGLSLYDASADSFRPVHLDWNLPGQDVFSILSDKRGNLWMATDLGLLRVAVGNNLVNPASLLYPSSSRQINNFYSRTAAIVTPQGEMLFGGNEGINSFYPDKIEERNFVLPIVITKLRIYGKAWEDLDEKLRFHISEYAPNYTDKMTIDYRHNNFSIEFAALDYADRGQLRYSYMLEGFDRDWQYAEGSHRLASYNNLSAGTYTFRVRALDADGRWVERKQPLQIEILPPPWLSWWAYCIYAVILAAMAYCAYKVVKNKLRLYNYRQLDLLIKSKAEEMNHSKLQFFTNITHELLTPLTVISASVDELRHVAPKEEGTYKVMQQNTQRLIRMLRQILEFRKSETGNLKLRVSRGDLAAFVCNCVDDMKSLLRKKRIQFSISCNPPSIMGYFDPDKVDKVLYNLLSNAAKYNHEDGMVWVSIGKKGNDAIISVKDNGKGIAPKALETLFQRFYEGDYRKYNTTGTGIGLSLTKDLITLHKGTISVSSQLGKGTEFKVVLPVNRDAYEEECIDDENQINTSRAIESDIEGEADEATAADERSDGNKVPDEERTKEHTLLLVEDNEELLELMRRLLSENYNIYTAANGREAMDLMTNSDIDLVVSDIMMPEMDGLEFCRRMKGNFATSHIPIIVLTAKITEEYRVEAYKAGADAFIAKPFNLTVLHTRISNLLKTRERANKDFKKQLVFDVEDLNYTSIDEDFLKRAVELVQQHLSDADYDQTKFVEDMHTSKSTLFRKLKSLTGLSYFSFVRNIRIKAACQIMEEKKHIRISELAYAVGFNDPKYFSACFKKEFGMHPSEYMKRFVQSDDSTGDAEEDSTED